MDRYLNRARAESFFMEDGQEVEASVLLRRPPAEAYALWVQHCWGGNAQVERKSFGGTNPCFQVGATRTTYQGTERVSVIAVPPEGNESNRIGSVHYELVGARGWFFQGYKAMVSFIPDDKNSANTIVVWVVKYDPTQAGIVLCCGGSMLRLLTRQHLKAQLAALQ
ncbi:hypothetical protein ACHHYP_02684 [Achlya hypogyna]|uniref:START domain-containing protein n=1 Tax=Achlya hypogyna TaxID=1202772 RepID=A0A1V9ZRX8_ACHHY|nr:hypothetical protein ACHHYP_02684 [Achlya hypogyna]